MDGGVFPVGKIVSGKNQEVKNIDRSLQKGKKNLRFCYTLPFIEMFD